MAEDLKHEMVSRAKLCEQAERYDDMADYMRQVTESGIGKITSEKLHALRSLLNMYQTLKEATN